MTSLNPLTPVLTAIALSLGPGTAGAQGGAGNAGNADLEVTMTLLPEEVDLPETVTRELELPRNVEGDVIPAGQAVERAAQGLETANTAREDGRAFGEAMAEAARNNREEAGRGGRPDREDLPDQVPDELPDQLPDPPGPPGSPPGPP